MAYDAELEFERPLLDLEKKIEELRALPDKDRESRRPELKRLQDQAAAMRKDLYTNLTPWQRVLVARHPRRPYTLDYVGLIFKEFVELHGDRHFGDDPAIVCGLARLDDRAVMVLGQQKGRDTKENLM